MLSTQVTLSSKRVTILAWFSDTDISTGERWGLELANQLEATDFGIICVTEESLQGRIARPRSGAQDGHPGWNTGKDGDCEPWTSYTSLRTTTATGCSH